MFDYPVFPPAGVTILICECPQGSHDPQQKLLCIDLLIAILTNMNKQRNTMKQKIIATSIGFRQFWDLFLGLVSMSLIRQAVKRIDRLTPKM